MNFSQVQFPYLSESFAWMKEHNVNQYGELAYFGGGDEGLAAHDYMHCYMQLDFSALSELKLGLLDVLIYNPEASLMQCLDFAYRDYAVPQTALYTSVKDKYYYSLTKEEKCYKESVLDIRPKLSSEITKECHVTYQELRDLYNQYLDTDFSSLRLAIPLIANEVEALNNEILKKM